ncbi:hypothetical protein D3C81_1186900 [compost metagenome]
MEYIADCPTPDPTRRELAKEAELRIKTSGLGKPRAPALTALYLDSSEVIPAKAEIACLPKLFS